MEIPNTIAVTYTARLVSRGVSGGGHGRGHLVLDADGWEPGGSRLRPRLAGARGKPARPERARPARRGRPAWTGNRVRPHTAGEPAGWRPRLAGETGRPARLSRSGAFSPRRMAAGVDAPEVETPTVGVRQRRMIFTFMTARWARGSTTAAAGAKGRGRRRRHRRCDAGDRRERQLVSGRDRHRQACLAAKKGDG